MNTSNLMARVFQRADQMGLVDDLPRLAGLSSARIAAIRSSSIASATEYEQLCRALAVDPVSMYRSEDTDALRTPGRFRAAISLDRPNAEDVRILALAAEQGRILAHLLGLLRRALPLAQHRKVLAATNALNTWRDGYTLGERARTELNLEPGPIKDLGQLMRGLGVQVARVTFSSPDVDAASVWELGTVPVVLINQASGRVGHPGAFRATLAHELCHLLHDAGDRNLTTMVSWGTTGKGNYNELVEVRARAFAPAFLAPPVQVDKWVTTLTRPQQENERRLVAALAQRWGLSFEGAAWHAKNCRLISAGKADQLVARPGQVDLGTFETLQTSGPPAMLHESLPETPAALWDGWATEVVLAALDEGHITAGRARELLTWG